jgi:hypothetical protein
MYRYRRLLQAKNFSKLSVLLGCDGTSVGIWSATFREQVKYYRGVYLVWLRKNRTSSSTQGYRVTVKKSMNAKYIRYVRTVTSQAHEMLRDCYKPSTWDAAGLLQAKHTRAFESVWKPPRDEEDVTLHVLGLSLRLQSKNNALLKTTCFRLYVTLLVCPWHNISDQTV